MPQKALFWEEAKALILADLHLGKAQHFRKNGMALSAESQAKDYENLQALINQWQPLRIIILGDLFHSEKNVDLSNFKNLIAVNSNVSFELVLGNHDILPISEYQKIGIKVLGETHQEAGILMTHYPQNELVGDTTINFCGHLHPAYFLQGKARQYMTIPSFVQTQINLVLPAFGVLTGLKSYDFPKNTAHFLIAQNSIKKVVAP